MNTQEQLPLKQSNARTPKPMTSAESGLLQNLRTTTLNYFRLLVITHLVFWALTIPSQGEELYNGIRLPSPWPPTNAVLLSLEPPVVPYLEVPPEVIPIDLGRQLFVDDFLVGTTTLTRVFHQAEYHPNNPVLVPDRPWEQCGTNPSAMVFSDGVWYDPADRLFKMWYMGGNCASVCYAVSKDGIRWEKPSLDVRPGSNIVLDKRRDSTTVWMDWATKDPEQRFKLFRFENNSNSIPFQSLYFSRDGIHWNEISEPREVHGDRSTVFYNPFRGMWVHSIRDYELATGGPHRKLRCRRYWESADARGAAEWTEARAPLWTGADNKDPRRPELNVQPELYNLDGVAYESLMLGLFDIWVGQPTNRPKPNYLALGFSRDGFHWDRPSREPFIPVSERKGAWNWGNVQSAGGCCLVVGDLLYFFVSGRAGVAGSRASGVSSTGLATLRRDGFASMDADGTEGTLTTRPVTFRGRYLFVNANASQGELRVEALDNNGRSIAPFAYSECTPVRGDKTLQAVKWGERRDISGLAGKPVRFRFYVKNARLYSFWVSPETSGASHGFVAAGGPGFTGPTDTVGGR